MKNTSLILLLLILILMTAPTASAENRTLTIRSDEWCPYNCEPGSEEPGYMIEIIREIFAEHGIQVDYQAMNWSRSIYMTRKGAFEAIVGAGYEEAPDFVFPQLSLGKSKESYFTLKDDDWTYTGPESLVNRRIAVIRDYDYGSVLNDFVEKNRGSKVIASSGEDAMLKNIRMLLSGRVDTVIDDRNVFLNTAKEMWITDRIRFAGEVEDYGDNRDNVYVAFSPAQSISETYAHIFDTGLKKLRETGRLDEIMAKYGLEPWPAPKKDDRKQ